MASVQSLLQPAFPLHHRSGTTPSLSAPLLSKLKQQPHQNLFQFQRYMQNLRFSWYHLSPFLIFSYCFFDISPDAYLFLRIIRGSSSFLPGWAALTSVTTSHTTTPKNRIINRNPKPMPNPIMP